MGGVEVRDYIKYLEDYWEWMAKDELIGAFIYNASMTKTAEVIAIAQQLSRIADVLECMEARAK